MFRSKETKPDYNVEIGAKFKWEAVIDTKNCTKLYKTAKVEPGPQRRKALILWTMYYWWFATGTRIFSDLLGCQKV